jgi:hypothetical protein
MRKLPEVQQAKELMNEAMEWSTFKWLFEKPRVRETADKANAALDRLNREVKAQWTDEVKSIYKELTGKTKSARRSDKVQQQSKLHDPQISVLIEKVADADAAARSARADAEDTFDEAEKQMSTSLAREGCKKAIQSWVLQEKAIRSSEALASANPKEQ